MKTREITYVEETPFGRVFRRMTIPRKYKDKEVILLLLQKDNPYIVDVIALKRSDSTEAIGAYIIEHMAERTK